MIIGYAKVSTDGQASRPASHTRSCRCGEFQIAAGENVPRVLDLQLLATSEEIPFLVIESGG